MAHISRARPDLGHEDDLSGQRAPVLTSEEQRTQETFRGPEFSEELARSRDLSQNFPEQILDFLGPLLIPQQRASARGRRNLQDVFRRTGGLKSSFAGRRFEEFERDASLNEILGLTQGAKSFFAPLAALQQNRLAVAGSPLSRSQGTRSGFGFPPQPGGVTNLGPRGGDFNPGGAPGGRGSTNPFDPFGPSFLDATGRTGFSGLKGQTTGGNVFFDPATGLPEPESGFGVGAGGARDFEIGNAARGDFDFEF